MKSVASILALLCIAHLQDVNANVKVFHKSVVNSDKRLVFSQHSYIDEHLTYALCENKEDSKELKCTIVREKQPYQDATYSCDVSLKSQDETIHGIMKIVPFGQDNAVLVWVDTGAKNALKFTTVQLTSCKVGEAKVDIQRDFSLFNLNIVGYNDHFEAFYKFDAVSCHDKVCRVAIDKDGHIINGPGASAIDSIVSDRSKHPIVSTHSTSKAYVYMKKHEKNYYPTLLKADGVEKSFEKDIPSQEGILLSVNNNFIGACYKSNPSEIKCNQYDLEGNSKLQATVPFSTKADNILDLYNSPSGGFYLIRWECAKLAKNLCANGVYQFVVERVDASGKKVGSLVLKDFDYSFLHYNFGLLFYENESKEVCFSVASFDGSKGEIRVTGHCFTDADFSK